MSSDRSSESSHPLPHPSFLSNLTSVYAHTESAPYTAVFPHGSSGKSDTSSEADDLNAVNAECLWWPPAVNESQIASGNDSVTVLLFLPGKSRRRLGYCVT